MTNHLLYTLQQFNLSGPQLDLDQVMCVYPYGSHLYGTATALSDADYLIVCDRPSGEIPTLYAADQKLSAQLYSPGQFWAKVRQHEIDALECIFLAPALKYESLIFPFTYKVETLRRSIAAVSSNSWVKCKKKLQEGEDYIGKKSLFHSLRIADFGIQIAINHHLVSYTQPRSTALAAYNSFRDLWFEIEAHGDWGSLKADYNDVAHALRTEFRIVAPWAAFDQKFEIREKNKIK